MSDVEQMLLAFDLFLLPMLIVIFCIIALKGGK